MSTMQRSHSLGYHRFPLDHMPAGLSELGCCHYHINHYKPSQAKQRYVCTRENSNQISPADLLQNDLENYRTRTAAATAMTPMMGATKPWAPLVLGDEVVVTTAADVVLALLAEAVDEAATGLETVGRPVAVWIMLTLEGGGLGGGAVGRDRRGRKGG